MSRIPTATGSRNDNYAPNKARKLEQLQKQRAVSAAGGREMIRNSR